MRLPLIGLAVAVALVVAPPIAVGHPGRATTQADHIAEDSATHDMAAESQLAKRTRLATAADALAADAAVAGNEHEVGSWGPLVDWPVVGVHVALLPNGKVLAYDSVGDRATETFPVHDFTRATVWDPETGTHAPVNVTGYNVFCSGLAHLTDGTLFLAGGNRSAALDGIVQTHVFNYLTNTWSLGPNMAAGRWYPTVTPLRNGEMLITEGGPDIPEVRTTAGALRRLTSASLNLPLYPWIHAAPDGRAFYAGPNQTMRALNTTGTGAWQSLGQRDAINRDYGSHALYDIGRILVAGGGASSADVRTININEATPQVAATAPMANGRRQHNLTVLADGTVLATGGNSSGAGLVDLNNGVYVGELWNPAGGGTWKTLAPEQATRQYHSTALLLADGRVLSSGGGICGTCDQVGYLAKNAQVFTPPYLYKTDGSGELAPRPAIASTPTSVPYGAGFQIATPDAAAIRKVGLIRLGAVTHSVNMEQRYVPLTYTAGAGALSANAPANADIAPPGVYMLFIVDANGVPSVAKMVNVGAAPPGDTSPPSAPSGLTATAAGSTQVNLSWTASTDNVGVTEYRVERCAGAGCTNFTQIATPTATTFNDTGRTASTTYRYQVRAADGAANLSPYSTIATATTPAAADTTPPSAAVTAPTPGSVVSGNVTVSANATDNVGVAGVQFVLDGANLGAEDTAAPYSMTWDTTTVSNGVHTLQARARDAAGNSATSSSSVTVTVSNAATPPPVGRVAGWAFNESLGTTVNDVTGNGNAATLQNDPTWTTGKYGGGLRFDGVNDFLTVLNSPSLNFSGTGLTLSMWINPLGGVTDQVPFGKFWSGTMASPFYQYGIELLGGSTPTLLIGTAGGAATASMGSPLTLGQWSHLAIAFNGTQARFYVNGNLVSSPSLSASITARDSLLHMGADASAHQFFNGTLDDVRLYTRAQSQAEVQSDMNTPLSAPAFDPTAPSVTITTPANDAVVSGIRTVVADATDDVGIAGVQFYVDGTPVGPEDSAPPYAANWDTRVTPNGAHTLTARARDTDNKTTLSALVNVTVANGDYFQNQVLATGFDLPTTIEFLPDGRMLVVELAGKIKVLPPPYTTPDPTLFLQITNITAGGVQEGIYDIALDPDFATNRHYYVFYTLGTPQVDRLSRFTANAALTGTVPGSELVLYQDTQTAFIEHHGGAIVFGNDGKLYFTTGEHFAATPSQDLTSPRGKVHRIDKDGFVPLDNPFYDGAGPNWDSVWAYGLRNPFRAYFDAPTNRLYIGDVGGNVGSSNEELNLGVRGANYGWPDSEGPCQAPCTSPLYDYEHNGAAAAIMGGFVYHGTQFPSSMQGNYFFGDYARHWIKRMTFDANGNVAGVFNFEPLSGNPNESAGDVVQLTEGPDGALYYVDLGYGDVSGTFGVSKIRRIRYLQSNQAPVALVSANPTSGPAPLDVSFSSAGSNDPEGQPLTYSWDFGDGTSSTASNPAHRYAEAGHYVVRLTVSDGENSSISTPLNITVGSAPTATISSPTDGAAFRAGDVISYGGDGTDVDDGALPASAFTWTIDFLHDNHVHPAISTTGAKSGTFTIPTSGHDFQGNTRYRITLTVMDSDGLRDTKSVVVWPQKVNLAFDTTPSGLTLYVDGIARTAPFVLDTLIGFNHTIEARNQTSGSNAYTFAAWSDGGAQSHSITAPSTAQSYNATYSVAAPPSGLAGAWGFSEGSGTTTADGSGNGNTASLLNGTSWVAGKYGSGLSFDGLNDNLSVANSSSLNIAGSAITISMWINPATITGDSVVLGKFWNTRMTSPYYQYGVELSGGRPQFFVGTASGLLGVGSDSALALNQWSHLAIVFNGSQVQFYVNGSLVSTKSLNATMTARGMTLRMGADADPWQFFRGVLDNVRIYNRSLAASDIVSDMATAVGA